MDSKALSVGAFLAAALLSLATVAWTSRSFAYNTYSVARDATNCRACHGDFRAGPYTSLADGQSWGDDLHDVHRNTMLNIDCETCHFSGRFPVDLGSSTGGLGLAAVSCVGCHGRSQDGTGTGTVGYGAGLRQHHWRAGVSGCLSCHTDADPAAKTVVGENVKPPYYANPGLNHPAIPTDPCNPSPAFVENFKGTTIGLDNDGDGQFDMADADCGSASPGEASKTTPLLVTGYDKLSGNVTVSFAPACAASNNNVEYGGLPGLPAYAYAGQVCAVGNTGAATFLVPANSFFLLVANDAASEGSYGTRRSGAVASERPEDTTSASCPKPQVLATRCDP